MRTYIISVVAAAMICAAARGLLASNTAVGRITQLLSGILLAVAVIAPLGTITFSGISGYWSGLSDDAQKYVTDGTAMAENQIADIIKSKTEAYILDKANRMGLQMSVEVELDEVNGNIPCGVVISGNVSPYAKEQLSAYMEDTLGITKEKQKWK